MIRAGRYGDTRPSLQVHEPHTRDWIREHAMHATQASVRCAYRLYVLAVARYSPQPSGRSWLGLGSVTSITAASFGHTKRHEHQQPAPYFMCARLLRSMRRVCMSAFSAHKSPSLVRTFWRVCVGAMRPPCESE